MKDNDDNGDSGHNNGDSRRSGKGVYDYNINDLIGNSDEEE